MTLIWGTGTDGRWQRLTPSPYPAEAALHDLIAEAPELLPLAGSPKITVLGREVRLGTGYADLLAVESSGTLAVIEVKLAANAEARRAVVAQVLSYAAYVQGLTVAQLEADVLAPHLRNQGAETVLAAVQAGDQQQVVDPHAFGVGLARSLADGRFRLVLVLDSAPDELVQIVGYLQLLTDRIQVDLVTVSAYEIGGVKALVPQRVEPARRVAELSEAAADARIKDAPRPGSEEFRAAVERAPADQRALLLRLTAWAEQLQRDGLAELETYRGKAEMMTLLPRLRPDRAGLVTIYLDHGRGYLQFWRSVFERRALASLARVEIALGGPVKQGNTTREVSDELLQAISEAYRTANNAAARL